MDTDDLVSRMTAAGRIAFGDLWQQVSHFALPELRKIAVQIDAIADHHADYTPAGARALFDMQVKAAIGVIVAMTQLTLLAVQTALNAILDAVRDFVRAAVPFPLL